MDLSLIIAHYNPGNNPACVSSFRKTLQEIKYQRENFNIEVIICDDGSKDNEDILSYNPQVINRNGRDIFDLSTSILDNWLKKNNYDYSEISHWLFLPKDKICMSKARLWNTAIELSKSENLFFLDDDNYFISMNSISTILELFDKYEVVFGQIQDKSGRFRNFESNRVQGTTFGIKKSVINDINGFGEWTEKTSCGIDSDLWLKLYNHFKNNNEFKACFTNSIQTIDSFSKRWKPFINTFFVIIMFTR